MMRNFKRSQYGAVKTEVDGIKFDSKKEAKRWQELKLMEHANQIQDLERQVSLPLYVAEKKICTYRADFVYLQDGVLCIEDAKGYQTDVFKLKWKLAQAVFPKVRFTLS